MSAKYIYLVGGPRDGDRLESSGEAIAWLDQDSQYLPFSGSIRLPKSWQGADLYIWNQLSQAALSQKVHEAIAGE